MEHYTVFYFNADWFYMVGQLVLISLGSVGLSICRREMFVVNKNVGFLKRLRKAALFVLFSIFLKKLEHK